LRHRDKWKLRSLQARISLERKESHDEEIPPQSLCGMCAVRREEDREAMDFSRLKSG
jgi:hypothetical protein